MGKNDAQIRYQKNRCKNFNFRLVMTTDADIIEHMEKQPNKAGYIKDLIRKDMKNRP